MGGLDGVNGEFAARLQAMKAAANAAGTDIGWGSGLRSVDEQIALRKKNGCPDVWSSPASSCRVPTAIPGRSNHNHGLAMDITGDKAWANANAHRFGLHFPVQGEDWHVEMIDDENARGALPVGPDGKPIQINMNWMEETRKPEDELSYRLDSIMGMLTQKPPEADTPEQMVQQGELAQDVTLLAGGDPSTRQVAAGGGAAGGGPAVAGDKLGNAQIIVQVGREMGLPDAAIQIGLATALVESNLINVNHGDRDSLGLFQQRPSQGWGTPDQVRDPYYAARKFFSALQGVNWQGMDPGAAAQAVQRSAYPGRYAERMGEARSIFDQIGRR